MSMNRRSFRHFKPNRQHREWPAMSNARSRCSARFLLLTTPYNLGGPCEDELSRCSTSASAADASAVRGIYDSAKRRRTTFKVPALWPAVGRPPPLDQVTRLVAKLKPRMRRRGSQVSADYWQSRHWTHICLLPPFNCSETRKFAQIRRGQLSCGEPIRVAPYDDEPRFQRMTRSRWLTPRESSVSSCVIARMSPSTSLTDGRAVISMAPDGLCRRGSLLHIISRVKRLPMSFFSRPMGSMDREKNISALNTGEVTGRLSSTCLIEIQGTMMHMRRSF